MNILKSIFDFFRGNTDNTTTATEFHRNIADDIYDYLKCGHSLTVLTCQRLFHTTELRHYISQLRNEDKRIDDCWVTGKNALGQPTHYKKYYIERNDEPPIAVVERANLEREYMQSRGI